MTLARFKTSRYIQPQLQLDCPTEQLFYSVTNAALASAICRFKNNWHLCSHLDVKVILCKDLSRLVRL
jgi:hypothetical protein